MSLRTLFSTISCGPSGLSVLYCLLGFLLGTYFACSLSSEALPSSLSPIVRCGTSPIRSSSLLRWPQLVALGNCRRCPHRFPLQGRIFTSPTSQNFGRKRSRLPTLCLAHVWFARFGTLSALFLTSCSCALSGLHVSMCLVRLPSPLDHAPSLYRLILLLVLSPRMPSAIFFGVSLSSLCLLLLPPLFLSGLILFTLFPLPLLFHVMLRCLIFLLRLHGVRLLFLLRFTSVMCNLLQILCLLWVLLLLQVQLVNLVFS